MPLSDHDDPSAATVTLSVLPTSPSVSLPVQENVPVPVLWQLTETGASSVESYSDAGAAARACACSFATEVSSVDGTRNPDAAGGAGFTGGAGFAGAGLAGVEEGALLFC